MCGINGIINSGKELTDVVNSMNSLVLDRGPDGSGTILLDDSAIGHTRLAIVDPANKKADQPMQSGDYIITFNGEIYNHNELRKELEAKGVSLRTNCDTEVLLEGFRLWGEEVLDKINGQFSFAVYNQETKETFLARDRTAMKPLYFSLEEGLQFSSNPKAISKNIGFSPDLASIATILLNGSAFAAGEEPLGNSTYEKIESLKPGECMKVSEEGEIEKRKYYSLPLTDEIEEDFETNVKNLRERLESSIIKRIPSEVNLGCALSGGLDSSIIAAIAANNYDGEIIASCIRYTADEHNEDYGHAKILAKNHENIKLVTSDITPENFLDDLEDMVEALGIHDSIRQLAMFRNYKVLKENGAKVVLTGEGADEFNWGYWHKFPGLKSGTCKTEEELREFILKEQEYVKSLFNEDIELDADYMAEIYSSFDTTDSTRKMMGLYTVDFLGFLNKANDRCGMANSIEARCPFQDVEVIETCLKIPYEQQIEGDQEKLVLREAFEDVLPSEIYERGKSPLPAANNIEYHRVIYEEFKRRIDVVDSSFWDYFNKTTFSKIAEEEVTNELQNTNKIFKLLTTMVWYDQNVGENYE